MKYLAMIAGGLGPDVWDRELNIEAADWNDANQQAVAQAVDAGGQVVSLDQSDDPFPPGHLGDYMLQVRAERDRGNARSIEMERQRDLYLDAMVNAISSVNITLKEHGHDIAFDVATYLPDLKPTA